MKAQDRTLVTVGGIDGSGKSVFADRIRRALDSEAVLVSVDDFRRPVDWARTDHTEIELYYEERYDFAALEACVQQFLRGEDACTFRRFDEEGERLGDLCRVSFEGARYFIVEGVFVGRLPSAAAGFSLHIEVSQHESRRRLLDRDRRQKHRTLEEVERRLAQRYLPAHARYEAEFQPRDRCVLLIDNEIVDAPRIVRGSLPSAADHPGLRQVLAGLLSR